MNPSHDDLYENNVIYRKFKSFFELGKKVYEFVNDCATQIPRWEDDESEQSNYRDVPCRLHFSSFKTFISILILCNKGHGEDAMILARTVFDNYLTLKYIQRDPENNIYRFMNYPLLENRLMLQRAKRPGSDLPPNVKKVYEEKEADILDAYRQVKPFYIRKGEDEKKSLSKFKSGRWAGISRRQMAEDVSLMADYDYVFNYHSCFAHPHAHGLSGFRQETESEVLYGAGPTDEQIFPVLPIAIWYLLLTLRESTHAFGLERGAEIESLLREVTKLEEDYLKKQGFEQ